MKPLNPEIEFIFLNSQTFFLALKIYNALVQEICPSINEKKASGIYHISWDGRDKYRIMVKSIVYFCRLELDHFSQIRKMTYMR